MHTKPYFADSPVLLRRNLSSSGAKQISNLSPHKQNRYWSNSDAMRFYFLKFLHCGLKLWIRIIMGLYPKSTKGNMRFCISNNFG